MAKTAALFPGQGVQSIGMGKGAFDSYPYVRDIFKKAGDILSLDIANLCFDADESELVKTENLQPCLVTVEVALYSVLKNEYHIVPDIMAGHSLGEISALICAGAMSFEDGITIARHRGVLMGKSAKDGAMASILDTDPETIARKCEEISKSGYTISISNYNTQSQTVVSGDTKAVKKICADFKEQDITVKRLNVSSAFHSKLMHGASVEFSDVLSNFSFNKFQIPVISNVTALPYRSEKSIRRLLTLQIERPVYWYKTLLYLKSHAVDTIIDIGPKSIIRNMVLSCELPIKAISFEKESEKLTFITQDGKSDLTPYDYVRECYKTATCLPNQGDNDEAFDREYIPRILKIKNLLVENAGKKDGITDTDVENAKDMLQYAFKVKNIPQSAYANSK